MGHVQTAGFQPFCAPQIGTDSQPQGRGSVQRTLRDSVAEALGVESRGRGMHGLAIAIREKLSASNAGADAVTSVLETIDRALDDAAAKLAAQGVSQEAIDAGVARFRDKLSREIGEMAGTKSGGANASLEKSAISAREVVRERLSLDVLTAEGDRVSIRFKSLNVTQVAAASVSDGKTTAIAAEAQVISRGRFQVQVDGDLNDAERAAIGDLLDKVDGIATDFFGGDVQAAFSAAARLGLESDALSAFDLKLSYSRLAAVNTYASTAKLGSEPVTQPEPVVVAAPVVVQAPVTPVAPAIPVMPVADAKAPDAAPASEGTATSAAVANNTAKAASAIQTITAFAKDVLERLRKDDDSDAAKFSLRWKVEFLVKAFGSVALTPVEQKAADALRIALDGQQPA